MNQPEKHYYLDTCDVRSAAAGNQFRITVENTPQGKIVSCVFKREGACSVLNDVCRKEERGQGDPLLIQALSKARLERTLKDRELVGPSIWPGFLNPDHCLHPNSTAAELLSDREIAEYLLRHNLSHWESYASQFKSREDIEDNKAFYIKQLSALRKDYNYLRRIGRIGSVRAIMKDIVGQDGAFYKDQIRIVKSYRS